MSKLNKNNTVQNNDAPNESKKKRNWLNWVLIAIIIILILLLLRCCGKCPFQQETPDPGNSIVTPSAPDIDPNAGDYVKPETSEIGGVSIPGWGKLTIPVNTSDDIEVDFYNPEANADKYYLTYELRIPANNEQGYETLYQSGLIEPGKHIQKIDLSRGLPAGTYNATLHVQPYRMEDKSLTNNTDLKLELVVK